jgi:hypothetical protein
MKNDLLHQLIELKFLELDYENEKKDIFSNANLVRLFEKKINTNELRERINKLRKNLTKEFSLNDRLELNDIIKNFEDLMKFYRGELTYIKERYGDEYKIPMEDLDEKDNHIENKYIKFFDKNRVKIKLDLPKGESNTKMGQETILKQIHEIEKKLISLKKKIASNINYLDIDKKLNDKVNNLLERVNFSSKKIKSNIVLIKDVIGKFDIYLNSLSSKENKKEDIYDLRFIDKKINYFIDKFSVIILLIFLLNLKGIKNKKNN